MNQDYQFQSHSGSNASESPSLVHAVSSIFSNSFGINPKTQKPYRLGPKTTKKRLALAHRLFLASDEANHPVGYLFATEIQSSRGSVGWIDSLAVLPEHRRKGVGTRLVENYADHFTRVRWIGCATPNPIAALVISKVIQGELYIGGCDPTEELVAMINEIRPFCQDLSGVDFNPRSLLVRTKFHPSDTGDNKEWCPPHPTEPPPWWNSLENLSSQYEALLIVDKRHEN
jgi:GNAT superfamily N-acetyltransferase